MKLFPKKIVDVIVSSQMVQCRRHRHQYL